MSLTVYGKYLLLKRLAMGGMAEIFLAKQTGLAGFEKLVVVKRILPHLTSEKEFVQMFLDEARLAASLSHPNVVQIYDLGQDPETKTYFIAMEYIAGVDLAGIMRKARTTKKPVPAEVAARIFVGACAGLHYAHTLRDPTGRPLNIVHRDVTPANLLVSWDGAVKVVDFGIAKAESHAAKTQAGTLKGKYGYMSPETIRGETLDGRSDVFALGICLHETLIGRRLYRHESELAILRDILEGKVEEPSKLRPDVPPELNAICLKALEKQRDKRFQSGHEMGRALEQFLANTGSVVDVTAHLSLVFAEEHRAHQQILAELPKASPEDLSKMLAASEEPSARTPGSSSFSAPSLRPGSSETRVTPPPRAAARTRTPSLAAIGLLVLGGGGYAAYRTLGPKPEPAPVVATPTAPAPAPTPAAGILKVMTQPAGATVYLDGQRQAQLSPVTIAAVAPTVEHTILIESEGYGDETLRVKVDPGGVKPIQVALKALPRPEKVAGTGRPGGGRGRAPPASATGIVSLSTTPAAEVLHRGRSLGRTPLDATLPAGAVALTFVNREVDLTQTVTVDVPAAGKSKRAIAFQKGKLAADVQPWADVYIGDRKLGTTPLAPRELYEGTYTLRLVNSEIGALKTVKVTVQAGKTTVIRENLQ